MKGSISKSVNMDFAKSLLIRYRTKPKRGGRDRESIPI
jgi:hypothetical protein